MLSDPGLNSPEYLIQGKEIIIVCVFSDNIQHEFTEPWMIELELGDKQVAAGTYMIKELTDLIEGRIELTESDKHPRINRMN